jgi:hypothetical protein
MVENYSAIKNEVLLLVTTWTELEIITLSEINRTKYHTISLLLNVKKVDLTDVESRMERIVGMELGRGWLKSSKELHMSESSGDHGQWWYWVYPRVRRIFRCDHKHLTWFQHYTMDISKHHITPHQCEWFSFSHQFKKNQKVFTSIPLRFMSRACPCHGATGRQWNPYQVGIMEVLGQDGQSDCAEGRHGQCPPLLPERQRCQGWL